MRKEIWIGIAALFITIFVLFMITSWDYLVSIAPNKGGPITILVLLVIMFIGGFIIPAIKDALSKKEASPQPPAQASRVKGIF